MRISNKVRRNISFSLLVLGVSIIIARTLQVVENPSSGSAWFKLFGIIVLTFICFERFRQLKQLVEKGILFGSKNDCKETQSD